METPVWDVVIAEMRERDRVGFAKYGRSLLPEDGRDSLKDAYEEALDMAVYLKKAMIKRDREKLRWMGRERELLVRNSELVERVRELEAK